MTTSGTHPTGVYVKGDDVRVAQSASAAVALVFEGYVLRSDEQPSEDKSSDESKPEVDVALADELAKIDADEPVEVAQVNEAQPVTKPTPKPRAPKGDRS